MLETLLRLAPVLFVYLIAAVLFCLATGQFTNRDRPSILLGDDHE